MFHRTETHEKSEDCCSLLSARSHICDSSVDATTKRTAGRSTFLRRVSFDQFHYSSWTRALGTLHGSMIKWVSARVTIVSQRTTFVKANFDLLGWYRLVPSPFSEASREGQRLTRREYLHCIMVGPESSPRPSEPRRLAATNSERTDAQDVAKFHDSRRLEALVNCGTNNDSGL